MGDNLYQYYEKKGEGDEGMSGLLGGHPPSLKLRRSPTFAKASAGKFDIGHWTSAQRTPLN